MSDVGFVCHLEWIEAKLRILKDCKDQGAVEHELELWLGHIVAFRRKWNEDLGIESFSESRREDASLAVKWVACNMKRTLHLRIWGRRQGARKRRVTLRRTRFAHHPGQWQAQGLWQTKGYQSMQARRAATLKETHSQKQFMLFDHSNSRVVLLSKRN